jgi:DNA-binding winged helix-turn-helix (wHTH) protein/TolB-like protein/Tfp pilus assembly protein PilF
LSSEERYQVGDLTVDVTARLLIRSGELVTLPPKTFELLVALVRSAPGVVSRQELMDSVWVNEIVNDEALTQRVMLLRRALGDDPKHPTYVASVPRWGYRVVAPVGRPDRAVDDHPQPIERPSPRARWRVDPRRVAFASAAAVAAVAVLAALIPIRGTAPNSPPDSLAVVPFSVDPTAEPAPHIRCGLPEGLTNSLSKLPGLRVVSWSTMTHFQGSELRPEQIASELGVSSLLVGRVTEERGMLHVMVELVDVHDGTQLWGESYLRPKESLFALQQQVTAAVARTLRPHLTAAELHRLNPNHTDSFEAYESYLKGRYCWNRREPEMIARAVTFFNDAIAADPGFAPAHAGLADCYVVLGGAPYGVLPPKEAALLATAAAEAAIRADPSLAEAHATLALLAWSHQLDWQRAADEFAVSFKLNPGYATAHQWNAESLAAKGDLDAAEREIRVALSLDPLSAVIGVDFGLIAYYRRAYPEAIARYQGVLEIEPEFSQALLGLALALSQAGRHDEAVTILDELVVRSRRAPPALAALGFACARAGDTDRAHEILDELLAVSRERYVPAYYVGGIYTGLGDTERAFEWMFRAVGEPSSLVASLSVEPGVDPLRDDPRFDELLRRLGLAG